MLLASTSLAAIIALAAATAPATPSHVISRDGTRIAYDTYGNGPPLIIVNGALSARSQGTELAKLLAPRFTVYSYDRRGRGDSTDTPPYSVQREVEDIEAEGMLAMAPTLAYDNAVLGADRAVPKDVVAKIEAPMLVLDGGASAAPMPFMRVTADEIARAAPNAQRKTIDGQAHDVDPRALAPVLLEFFR